jgi:hypothetical protein
MNTLFYGLVQFNVTLVPIVYSEICTSVFDWWSLWMNFISSMDHPKLDPIELVLMDVCSNVGALLVL